MEQKRLKSKVVWTSILAQVLLILAIYNPDLSITVKVIGGAVLEILTTIGILNNPTDSESW